MKSHATTMTIFVGVDVSKASLDIYRPDTLERIKINNSETSVADFCQQLQKKKRSLMVVMEATGGYETLLVNQLALHDLKAAVVNPRRVRDFAKGIGIDAKTDPIDAKVLSRYGEVVSPKPKASKSEHEQKHGALVARRNQLLELINQEKNRLGQSWDEDARQSIREVLEMLKKQLKNIDSQLAKMLKADSMNPRKIEILLSAKGVGPVMTSTLVAKLAGVAPINRDSGRKSGKRFISGGRGQVRRVLYMATIVAIRHNPAIKAFYQHLKSKGKVSKVAIVACMRKFITISELVGKERPTMGNQNECLRFPQTLDRVCH